MGGGILTGQALIAINLYILHLRTQEPESAGQNVSGDMWEGAKVNFPLRTLNKIQKFFAVFPMVFNAVFFRTLINRAS